MDELQPSAIESSEAIAALGKRVASDGKAVTRIAREREARASKLALEGKISEHADREAWLQEEYDEQKRSESGGVGSLTEEQEVELERIRDAAAVASAAPRRELQSALRQAGEEGRECRGRRDDAERSAGELRARSTAF